MAVAISEYELRWKYNQYEVRHQLKMKAHNSGSAYHMKDSEKNKTYQCEWALEKLYPEIDKKLSKKETEQYVKRVCRSKFWQDNARREPWNPPPVPRVEWMKDMGAGRRQNANATKERIRFSPSGASKYVVLHELAHVAGFMNHGRGFRVFLLMLVSRFLGREVSKDLKRLFKANGLKTSKMRGPLPYETWKERYLRNASRNFC